MRDERDGPAAQPADRITKFESLATASENLIQTDLPASQLGTFAELALKARSQDIGTVSFVPPAINTGDPDIAKIRSMITRAVDRSEAPARTASAASGTPRSSGKGFSARHQGASTGGSIGSMANGYAANQSKDLSKVC